MSAILTDFSSITSTLAVEGGLARTSQHGPNMARDGMHVRGEWFLDYRHGRETLCPCGIAMRKSWLESTVGQFGIAEYLNTSGAMQACWGENCVYLGRAPFVKAWSPSMVPVAVAGVEGTAAEGVSSSFVSIPDQKTLAERVAALNAVQGAFKLYDLNTGRLVPEDDLRCLALSNYQGSAGYTAVSHTWGRYTCVSRECGTRTTVHMCGRQLRGHVDEDMPIKDDNGDVVDGNVSLDDTEEFSRPRSQMGRSPSALGNGSYLNHQSNWRCFSRTTLRLMDKKVFDLVALKQWLTVPNVIRTRYVWVDWLCIEQQGQWPTLTAREIAAQQDIFSCATDVVVLSSAPEAAVITDAVKVCESGNSIGIDGPWIGIEVPTAVEVLAKALSAPWFTSAWTVVECILAGNSRLVDYYGRVHCNSEWLPTLRRGMRSCVNLQQKGSHGTNHILPKGPPNESGCWASLGTTGLRIFEAITAHRIALGDVAATYSAISVKPCSVHVKAEAFFAVCRMRPAANKVKATAGHAMMSALFSTTGVLSDEERILMAMRAHHLQSSWWNDPGFRQCYIPTHGGYVSLFVKRLLLDEPLQFGSDGVALGVKGYVHNDKYARSVLGYPGTAYTNRLRVLAFDGMVGANSYHCMGLAGVGDSTNGLYGYSQFEMLVKAATVATVFVRVGDIAFSNELRNNGASEEYGTLWFMLRNNIVDGNQCSADHPGHLLGYVVTERHSFSVYASRRWYFA